MGYVGAQDSSSYTIDPEGGTFVLRRMSSALLRDFGANADEVTKGNSFVRTMLAFGLGVSATYFTLTHHISVQDFFHQPGSAIVEPQIPPQPQPRPFPRVKAQNAARPLSMGGWPEIIEGPDHPGFDRYENAAAVRASQVLYLQHRAELRKEIEACRADPSSCNPNIKAFSDMLDEARVIPDPKTRLEALSGWINLFVVYDNDEARTSRVLTDHRSMVDALKDGLGVCDEQAQLKLFGAESVGFRENDLRLVLERSFRWKGNQETEIDRHAVVAARVGQETWVMNNNDVGDLNVQSWSNDRLYGDVVEASRIETAATHLGYSTNSMFSIGNDGTANTALPIGAFNSSTRSVYGVLGARALEADRHAPKSEISVDGSAWLHMNGAEPLRVFFNPALAQRFGTTLGD